MTLQINLNAIYVPSDNIVAREIEGDIIIVPLTAGIGDLEDDLFSLNDTGRGIWRHLDGVQTVRQIVAAMSREYDVAEEKITPPVCAFLDELVARGIVIEKTGG